VVDEQHGPLPALLLALTVLAGVVDAVSILRLGHVFVATMTGNLVFIGLGLAGAKGFAVGTSALAVGGFLTGPTFPVGARDAMVTLLAMSMGAQLAAIRYLKVPDLLTVVLTMTITGVLTERGSGWTDPGVLRRPLALVAFAVGALCGALLALHVGTAAALLFGLAIIIGTTIAAHLVSRAPSDWSAPQSP
jgi:uncharacterized membrane protein YoaK (UPF0700 family)